MLEIIGTMPHCTFQLLLFHCSIFYPKLLPKRTPKQTLHCNNVPITWQVHCVKTTIHANAHLEEGISSEKDAFSQRFCQNINRKLVNYKPSSWSLELLESFGNYREMEVEKVTIKKLEEEVRCMLDDHSGDPLELLELIDDIHRVGLGYRFREDTNRAIQRIIQSKDQVQQKFHNHLHASALYFRLLRQYGHQVSTDIFDSFKDTNGNFSINLATDIIGMLSLYEASHLAINGETTLDDARDFSSFHLQNMLEKMDNDTAQKVIHALELPFHNRMQRLEARWNIERYDYKQNEAKQLLHMLAILDFNMVQSTHQQELQGLSRWWRELGLTSKLSFARDRLVESFFWAVGMVFEPQHGRCRTELTKVVKLITVIDDVYDVYGSLQELDQFTNAVERWDVSEVKNLPDYMKLCFLALYNTVNNIAYDTLKEQGQVIIPPLQKAWADLCKKFLQEAKWRNEKHIPKFDEYVNDHGWISSSGAVLLVHAYFLTSPNITEEAITYLTQYQTLLQFPCTIFRLANDLSTSKVDIERGETAKAISCYMHEMGESEEVARAYIRKLIDENWKMMNKEMIHNSFFNKSFIEIAMNLARIALCQYQYGDAHSSPDDISRNRILSVIVEPVQFVEREKIINYIMDKGKLL
ncbi:Isoprene synthase [Handroanthus impetiginosus]|uniref:Isoprene synthase n=1 Tax=Handroanthus impetiginosus TaxID=429701 RepID=A0A2G9GX49_9LAMI|nr:Isoprene synthase [Handroanthus impetiginosus]